MILFIILGEDVTLVLTWIRNSISITIAYSILFIETAKDFWNNLSSGFAQPDVFRMAELQGEITIFSQVL